MEWQNGIDSVAHNIAIDNKGKTIAILGSGFNNIFPKENIQLYNNIIKNNGLIITEYPPNEKAKSENFIKRNRIISGLSIGVLVIEAAYRSGTSVTAKYAKEQGRKVFALPHDIDDKNGIGTNRLIKKGAILVGSVIDIIKEYEFIKYKKKEIKEIRNVIDNNNNRKKCVNKEFSEIYNLITQNPITTDEIYKKSLKNVAEINNILLMLELEGYIEKIAGGYKCVF